jgi:endo-1,4-beta-xylanase
VTQKLDRRLVLGGALALAACQGRAQATAPAVLPAPLKALVPFPLGCAVMTGPLDDPAFVQLLTTHFGQITPEFELKMEVVLREDGGFDFARPDRLAAFARSHGLGFHAHTLVWYAEAAPAFQRLDGAGKAFADAYRNYILAVAGRYRGLARAWDVVNEPVEDDGSGYRACLWRRNLGLDYVARAFHHAREADPHAVLFLNDYNLESSPNKRLAFLRLAEQVLKAGAPLGGLGSQSHLAWDLAPGAVKAAVRDLASLGLPVHISELDVSLQGGRFSQTDRQGRLQRQARLVGEASEALAALPPAQRYGLTVWALRDGDSWLRRPPNAGDGTDAPVLFDDAGAPKPAAMALIGARV